MMTKASPIFYDGNKIVRMSDLPVSQAHLFSGWVTTDQFVVLGEKNDYDCVKYEDYEYWFQNYYATTADMDEWL
ncbi:MAG: hypothetical protein ACI9A7_001828 [Cyclobacteriaceae bacterium]|jgi:hypothetical protein